MSDKELLLLSMRNTDVALDGIRKLKRELANLQERHSAALRELDRIESAVAQGVEDLMGRR